MIRALLQSIVVVPLLVFVILPVYVYAYVCGVFAELSFTNMREALKDTYEAGRRAGEGR